MWLDNEILAGLQRLLILRLRDAPALDTIELLADTWIHIFKRQPITWDEALDATRIRKAFLACASMTEVWPSPRTVLLYLPSRPEHLKIAHEKVYRMPENVKALLHQAVADSALLTDEQRRAKINEDMATLEALVRAMPVNLHN